MSEKARFFTTGEVSRVLGISQRTVKNYCDIGKITCIQTPITNYRRIPEDVLLRFMEENSIPTGILKKIPKKKILVIEDDEIFRDYMKELLTVHFPDVELVFAIDGYEACLMAVQSKPDLICMDLKIPKEDGVKVCRKIKESETTKHFEIIIVTAHLDKAQKAELTYLNIRRIFGKPLVKEVFLKVVHDILNKKIGLPFYTIDNRKLCF